MDAIAAFTPEQARLLWQDYQSRKQSQPNIQHNYPQRRPIDEVSPHRVLVTNASGETVPPYGCMRITGTQTVAGRTTVTVEKPTATTGEFVFNSQFEIATGEYGWAYRYGIVVMLGDGVAPSAANVEYSPIVGSWDITEASGPFVVFGTDIDVTDGLIGRFAGTAGGGHHIWFTIISVECPSPSVTILTVLPTHYSRCTGDIPGADPYTCYVEVEDVCSILAFYTSDDLVGRVGRATYMYPYSCGVDGDCATGIWLVDTICGAPECA